MPIRKRWIALIVALVALLLIGVGLQIWGAVATRQTVLRDISAPVGAATTDIEREKTRQEAIAERISNDSKALMASNLATGLGAALGLLVTVSGGLLALYGYFDQRAKEAQDRRLSEEKDRQDRRQSEEKDRRDRLAKALSEALERLVAAEPRQRVVGAAGLSSFFSDDKEEFHLQAVAALVAAARSENEPAEVQQSVRLALEEAARTVKHDVLAKLSWQGVRLPGVDLRKRNLSGLDLRDAVLENARLEGARLDGANLTAAKLQGAQLVGATLLGCDLTYADFAGASWAKARLAGATIDGVKLLNLDLADADLKGLGAGWRSAPWDATRNWRQAQFDPEVWEQLLERYGAQAPDLKVLMLMWEAPPYVAGGTWTACYHLCRKLKQRGVDVTVVVPWAREVIDPNPFGIDVPIVALGIMPPMEWGSAYGGAPSWSPYAPAQPAWSPYGAPVTGYAAGPYGLGVYGGGSYGAYAGGLAGSILYRLIGEFRRRVERYVSDHRPDVIHAHDWVCFGAATAASAVTGAPWIAHFHSIEADRQPGRQDKLTMGIERTAVTAADALITPSSHTRARLMAAYGKDAGRAQAIANLLSEERTSTADMGRFETRRVVFVGRLSAQKGLDRFGEVADKVRLTASDVRFEVFGDGEDRWLARRHGLEWRGAVDWSRRGEAYAGASAVVVPSRSEPFGMVILEAMQHRVPVIYPEQSGAAEVLKGGVKVDPADIDAMTAALRTLLGDLTVWEQMVRAEAGEIDAYPRRDYDDQLIGVWRTALEQSRAGRPPP